MSKQDDGGAAKEHKTCEQKRITADQSREIWCGNCFGCEENS